MRKTAFGVNDFVSTNAAPVSSYEFQSNNAMPTVKPYVSHRAIKVVKHDFEID